MQRKQPKTALRSRSHRSASSPTQDSGLIAKSNAPRQSASTKCALDNRSHRTSHSYRLSSYLLGLALIFAMHARIAMPTVNTRSE
jgi:hypothetical protein